MIRLSLNQGDVVLPRCGNHADARFADRIPRASVAPSEANMCRHGRVVSHLLQQHCDAGPIASEASEFVVGLRTALEGLMVPWEEQVITKQLRLVHVVSHK